MTETIKLYDRDAYATEFEADIISCEPNKADDKRFDIILNQTLFFPEEGGQSPDMGILGGFRVVDVQIKNGVITHTVDISAGDCCIMGKEEVQTEKKADEKIIGMECASEKAELAAGVHVQGKIDWQHRFYNMQQHSGEHIFSGIVHSLVPISRHFNGTLRIVLGKSLTYILIYVVVCIWVLAVVPKLFSLPQVGDPVTILLFILPYLFASIFFAMTLSGFMTTREAPMLVFVFTSVILLFISGVSWPKEAIPPFWQAIGYLFLLDTGPLCGCSECLHR